MAVFENCEIEFPYVDRAPVGKPEFHPGFDPKEIPGDSVWFAHDPAIFKDEGTGYYYAYCTHYVYYRSRDLIHWENMGKVMEEPPVEAVEWTHSKDMWAPDVIKVGKEYRMYCSNSSWGVQQSVIYLAVAKHPEGPFVPKGIVLKTDDTMPVNGIDANPVVEEETGEMYMAYGSFWGGCYLLKLDKKTGLAGEKGVGICLARRPKFMDTAIEGPYIRYHKETGYYYLFVSYGSLNSDYSIRVGRSKKITGPYLDHNGRDMRDLEDTENGIGFMAACGYHFEGDTAYMGPGHNSVLCDDGRWYLVCHIREADFKRPQISAMHIYQMFFTKDGWPVLNPMRYAGERRQRIERKDIVGQYDRIRLAPAMPQGVTNSVYLKLNANGRMECCSIVGTWKMSGEDTITISYGPVKEELIVCPAWDWEKMEPTLALTGVDSKGIAIWGRKVTLPKPPALHQ
jgi:arabinan endo-1,5-alpha-L-arabinosidase